MEGPRARATSYTINKLLSGKVVREIFIRSRKTIVAPSELVGRRLLYSDSFGKSVVLFFENNFAIRIHPLIYGVIRIFRINKPLDKPDRQIRLKLVFDDYCIVGFNTPIIELNRSDQIVSFLSTTIGLDPFKENWDRRIVIGKMKSRGSEKIGVIIMDQSIIAGVGNILRNEILYRAGVNPERTVDSLTDDELNKILEVTEYLFQEFYNKLIRGENIRELFLVHNKYRGRCTKCGSRIKFYRQEPINRKTFICPVCQK